MKKKTSPFLCSETVLSNSTLGLCFSRKVCGAILLTLSLGVTACTPRDVKVVDESTRLKINTNKNGPFSNVKKDGFNLENSALASFLIEKQIEAIDLIKVSTGRSDLAKSQYSVSTSDAADKEAADNKKQVNLVSSQDVLDYVNTDGRWLHKIKKSLAVSYTEKESVLMSLEGKAESSKMSVDAADLGKTYVNLVEDSYVLKVTAADEKADVLQVNVLIEGSLSGAKGTANASNKISINLKMAVDQASLKSSDVKIISSRAEIFYPGFNGKTFNLVVEGSNYAVKGDGLCLALTGLAHVSAGPKIKFDMISENDVITASGKNWTKSLATCGKRPTIDLSRFLFN
jgi:hypothetical protein